MIIDLAEKHTLTIFSQSPMYNGLKRDDNSIKLEENFKLHTLSGEPYYLTAMSRPRLLTS